MINELNGSKHKAASELRCGSTADTTARLAVNHSAFYERFTEYRHATSAIRNF
jgi:hypothetical protein